MKHLKDDAGNYPPGLTVHLDEETIKKLGFQGLPKVGDKMELVGKVKVAHTSSHDSENGKMRSIGLQFTHLDFEEDESDKPDKADVLYGGKKKSMKSTGTLNSTPQSW